MAYNIDSTEEDMRIRKGVAVTHKIHERRVRFAGHKTSGDTVVKTNTLGADARTRF